MDFRVLQTAELAQTATMTLHPGERSGPTKENEHAQSEQVLYLARGTLKAEIGDRTFVLHAGDAVIVRRGESHRFTNDAQEPAVTFNVYAPPAY